MRDLLRSFPGMPVTVVAERVGWVGTVTNLRRHVRAIPGGLRAGRSGGPVGLPARGSGSVLSVVPAGEDPIGARAGRHAAGAGDGGVVLPVLHCRMMPTRTTTDLLAGM